MADSLAEQILPNRVIKALDAIIQKHNSKAANGKKKVVGFATQETRRMQILQCFAELHQLGKRIENPRNLGENHVKLLVQHWEGQGLSASSLQKKICVLRVFARWIGKVGMVKESKCYVSNLDSVKRQYIAREDTTWEARGIDVNSLIQEVAKKDESVAMFLKLQYCFGLRRREAIMFRPKVFDRGHYIVVREGTKGGRERVVDVNDDVQRAVLEEAKAMADKMTGRINKRGLTIKQAINRYKNVVRACGIRKDTENGGLGVVGHALRHGYANKLYLKLTGVKTPLQGGKPEEIDREKDDVARAIVSEALGHIRIKITTAYTGSHGHDNRRMPTKPKLNWSGWGSIITVDANLEKKQEEEDQLGKDENAA